MSRFRSTVRSSRVLVSFRGTSLSIPYCELLSYGWSPLSLPPQHSSSFSFPLGPWGRQGLWERGFLFCVAAWQVLAAAPLLGYERFRSNIALQQTAGAGAHARGERPRSPAAAAERGRWT